MPRPWDVAKVQDVLQGVLDPPYCGDNIQAESSCTYYPVQVKLRANNKPSCTLAGAKSRHLPLERECRCRQQNCWTRHDGQREGLYVVSAMEKGRRNTLIDSPNDGTSYLGYVHYFLCQSILCIPDGPHSSATWITAFALFVPF
jgi:hypothetical protein